MIARVAGRLEELRENTALVVLGSGLAYEVMLPAYLGRTLESNVGQVVEFVTLEYLESLNQGISFVPRLIGFGNVGEREFFELLTTVKGLGNKRALRAMVLEPGSVARAIYDRDGRALQRLPEIGPKLAELIIHELKNKVDRFAAVGQGVAAEPGSAAEVEAKGAGKKPRVRLGDGASAGKAGEGARAGGSTAIAGAGGGAGGGMPPIRQTVETLIALGEAPPEAERIVSRAVEQARAAGRAAPVDVSGLLAAAYAAR